MSSFRKEFMSPVIPIASFCIFLLLPPICAYAEDPMVAFSKAKNAFDAGNYPQSILRFENLLVDDYANPAIRIEAHKYLGISYLFTESPDKAAEQFLLLLNLAPDFELDPMLYPIDVVDFFTEIKTSHSERLQRLNEAQKKAEKERQRRAEAKRKAELEKLKQYVYIQNTVTLKSKVVSMVPFGAGQFQNGHRKKGFVFLSGELLLITASAVTFGLHESLREKAKTPFYSKSTRKRYEQREIAFRVANQASIIGFGIMALVGIVDSIYHFNWMDSKWEKVNEDSVPLRVRQHPGSLSYRSITPIFLDDGAGVQATVSF